jgi:hypothetical protein
MPDIPDLSPTIFERENVVKYRIPLIYLDLI